MSTVIMQTLSDFLHIDVRVVRLRLVSLSITEPSVSGGNVRVGDLPCFAENMQLSRRVAGQAEGCFSKALFLMRFLDCYSKLAPTPKYESVNFCFSPPVQALTVSKS